MIIAGIGSRETPPHILAEMTRIGAWCREAGITVRSGHAEGADWAFEQGAQEACEVYLPWASFNAHLKSKARQVVLTPTPVLERLAAMVHPAWGRLSRGARLLMMRNVQQILGPEGTGPQSTTIVCWTKDGLGGGGTGQALRIGGLHHVLIYDMAKPGESSADYIIERLKQIRKDLFDPVEENGLDVLL